MEEYAETTDTAEEYTETYDTGDEYAETDSGYEAEETETDAESTEGIEDVLMEKLDALVDALTNGEEDEESSKEASPEDEAVKEPSEAEQAVLEALKEIHEDCLELITGQETDMLACETRMEAFAEAQEKTELHNVYIIAVLLGLSFLTACITGLIVSWMVWGRFK